jgi:hypothetical protein
MALYRTRLGVPDEAEDRAVGAFVDVDLGSDADLGSQAFDVVPEPLRLRLFGMEILAGGSRARPNLVGRLRDHLDRWSSRVRAEVDSP